MPIFAAWFQAWPEIAGSPVRPESTPYFSVNAGLPPCEADGPAANSVASAASGRIIQMRLFMSLLLAARASSRVMRSLGHDDDGPPRRGEPDARGGRRGNPESHRARRSRAAPRRHMDGLQDLEVLEHALHLLLLGWRQVRPALPGGPDGDPLQLGRVLHQLDPLPALEEHGQRDDPKPEVARLLDAPHLDQVEELDAELRDDGR